jgi:ribose transport system substrate-binding protein
VKNREASRGKTTLVQRELSRREFLKAAGAGLSGAALFGVVGCGETVSGGGGGGGGQTAAEYLVESKEGPYVVGLSNSFIGNSFRAQMVAELEYATQQNDQVESFTVANANNDVSQQNSQIGNLVSQGVDILLVDPASKTALNGALQRAHQQGVLVVAFDAEVTSPHAINVNPDQIEFGRVGGQYLLNEMGGEGSIFGLNGIAGNPTNNARWEGARKVLQEAGVEIVGQANAAWDQAQGRQAASDLLTSNPDVTGIYSQGGAMSLGALQVLESRGMDLLPIPGEGYNGFLKRWQQLNDSQGWNSVAPSQPPYIGTIALDFALRAIQGEDVGKNPKVELPVIRQADLADSVRPDFPDSLWLPTKLPDNELRKLFN